MPPVTWGDHLDIARAVASIGGYDVGECFALMAIGLHLLQRDLLFADEIALAPALNEGAKTFLPVVNPAAYAPSKSPRRSRGRGWFYRGMTPFAE